MRKKIKKILFKIYKINYKNVLGHSDISPDRKKDPGEKFPWEILSKKGLAFWHDLNKKMLKNNRLKKLSLDEKSEFFRILHKIGYNKVNHIKTSQSKRYLTKSFQRRFRQDLVNGIIDKECLLIIRNLDTKIKKS